jgi:hypothetical protein
MGDHGFNERYVWSTAYAQWLIASHLRWKNIKEITIIGSKKQGKALS